MIVLLTTQDIPAIKNVRLFLDLLQTLGVERGRIVFAMNRFDKRNTITPERVGETLKQEITAVIPLDSLVVNQAVIKGVPFVLENRDKPSARGIFDLAAGVRARLAEMEAEDAGRVAKR